jgi:hypothetical protein
MNRPNLRIKEDKLAFAEFSSAIMKKAWVMDPPPWLPISDKIRVEIYKNQLVAQRRLLEIEIQSLQIEMDMLNKSMELIK